MIKSFKHDIFDAIPRDRIFMSDFKIKIIMRRMHTRMEICLLSFFRRNFSKNKFTSKNGNLKFINIYKYDFFSNNRLCDLPESCPEGGFFDKIGLF